MLNDSSMTNSANRIVYVDADSCPVKEEVMSLSRLYKKEMVFVFSYAHSMVLPDDVKTAIVDTDKEAADLYCCNDKRWGHLCDAGSRISFFACCKGRDGSITTRASL